MQHWIRDCAVDVAQTQYNHGNGETNFTYYHFLRTAGWSLIWECDGTVDNHCPDASMEATDTSSWTAVGTASLAKSTSQKHMGSQSLQVTSLAASDGVLSDTLTSMAPTTTYRLTLWAYNNTGQAWDVQADTGLGSFSSIGTIPSDGAWTEYVFSFTMQPSGSGYFRILDVNNSQGTIYLDSVILRQSLFEYNYVAQDFSGSPDGQILNGNEFHSASYSFTVNDVDRYVCIWDPTNLGNSGVYKITNYTGSDAQLDLRAGGTPALTSQTGLRWRLFDTTTAPKTSNEATTVTRYAGWGLESPHSEKWRLFMRNNWKNVESWLDVWCSPYDADFDVETGNFLNTEIASTQVNSEYSKGQDYEPRCQMGALNASANCPLAIRTYLQTDDSGTFVIFGQRTFGNSYDNYTSWIIAGFTGADSYHSLRESFALFGNQRSAVHDLSSFDWSGDVRDSPTYGVVQVSDLSYHSTMVTAKWMLLGYGNGSGDVKSSGFATNARVNPFGPARILMRPKIARDYYGYYFRPTEKLVTTMGLWDGIPDASIWESVESNSLLVISGQGVFLELPSSGGVGLFEPLP